MKRSLFVAMATILALTPLAHAQDQAETTEATEESAGLVDRYTLSLGVGTGIPLNPETFKDGWSPAFGLGLAVGAQKNIVEVVADFNFDFFVEDAGLELLPDDVSMLSIFLLAKIKPLETKARPYIVGGGGYYRFWLTSTGIYENVLGYTGGAGLEIELNEKQQLYLEGRYLVGRARVREISGDLSNIETITARIGASWFFE